MRFVFHFSSFQVSFGAFTPDYSIFLALLRTIDELGLDRSIVSGIVQCFFHKIPPPLPPTNQHTHKNHWKLSLSEASHFPLVGKNLHCKMYIPILLMH